MSPASRSALRSGCRPALRGVASWMTVVVLTTIGGACVATAVGWRLLAELRRLRVSHASLSTYGRTIEQQMKELEGQRESTEQARKQVEADRDNLLIQVKRALEQRDQAEADYRWLEGMFQRTAGERLGFLSRLKPLEAEHAELEQELNRLIGERAELEQQLADARSRTEEQRLKEQLAAARQEREKSSKDAASLKQQVQRLELRRAKVETDLGKLSERFGSLQGKYAAMIAENRSLRHETSTLPRDMTRLAKEHERLVKDVVDTHYNMGVMFAQRKDYPRAVKEFEKVVELRPEDPDAHYNLGLIYAEQLPDSDRALEHFRRFLVLTPTGGDANWVKQYIASWQATEAKERLQ